MEDGIETDDSEAFPSGATGKLLGFSLASGIWIVGALGYGWYLGPPEAANEWGDLIAGVFAPAAFLWLIGAVWIQSDELREQRKELILTRKEFAYNREVMQAQAEEARKQAEYIGIQTQLLQAEDRERRQAKAERQHAAIVNRIASLFRKEEAVAIFPGRFAEMRMFYPEGVVVPADAVTELSRQCRELLRIFRSNGIDSVRVSKAAFLMQIYEHAYRAEELQSALPFIERKLSEEIGISDIIDCIGYVADRNPDFERLAGHQRARFGRRSVGSQIEEMIDTIGADRLL